jgi:D-hexose-6-phosphate mutarotase
MPTDAPAGAPLPPSVRLGSRQGLRNLEIATPAAAAQAFFHGAHVAEWTPAHAQVPVLWLSTHSHFTEEKGIRGGVPICFPWFGPHESVPAAPAHGFARLVDWTLVGASESDGAVTLSFGLQTSEASSPLWPHRCRATFTISVGATLAMALAVTSEQDEPFTFEEALHTYCRVEDVERVSIAGLEGTEYLDKVEGFARRRQPAEPIRFSGETDRVYIETTATCRISDPGLSRTIVIAKSGSRSTVVWNPWAERARTFPDFGADEWRQMVCVETANVRDAAVRLAPGESHVLGAEISVEPSP